MSTIATQSPFGLPYEERWTPEQVQECVDLFQLNETEQSSLLELKERLSDAKDYWANGPFELARFVLEHTCHGKVDTMEQRFRKCMEWRTENGIDTILERHSPPMKLAELPLTIMEGTDKEGDAIAVVRQADRLGLIQRYGKDEFVQGMFWIVEFLLRGPWQREWAQKNNRRLGTVTVVLDMKGLNRRHIHPTAIPVAQKISGALQMHYPHVVKKVLVINAPSVFRFVWYVAKPFILPHVRAMMEVATEPQTEALLEEYLDLEVMPEFMFPGKGQGKSVPGRTVNWDIGLLPPASPQDWERAPLVYEPSNKSEEARDQDTASMHSSTGGDSVCEDFIEAGIVRRTSGTTLLKGTWVECSGATAVDVV